MAVSLNAKQLRFVELYQQTIANGSPNATSSYLEAYPGCSRASAESAAARLLKDVRVQQLLQPVRQVADAARVEQVRGIEITRDRIRLEMARLAYFDPRRLFDADGNRIPIHLLDEDTAVCLAQFEVEEETDDEGTVTRVTKVKAWDKRQALRDLADTEPGVWAEDAKEEVPGGTTNVNVTVVNRIDQYAAAFAGAADREGATADGPQPLAKPVQGPSPTAATPAN